MNEDNLNNWAISTELFEWIVKNFEEGSTILELGSGTGTIELCKHFDVYSVENDERWLNTAKDSTYIHAPIRDYELYRWYDIDIVKKGLPKEYDLIIVDGPIGSLYGRDGFYYNIDLFNTDVPIVIDDTHRMEEYRLARFLSTDLDKMMYNSITSEKGFTILV